MQKRKIKATLVFILAILLSMVGLVSASVPLYRVFCKVTGYGGTTRVATTLPQKQQRKIVVKFDADHASNLPWDFKPMQKETEVTVGEPKLAFYYAKNKSGKAITGTATYNVLPMEAAVYFNKIECFCFTEQTLLPGQQVEMPVSFFIDPDIEKDPKLKNVKTITLYYNFFKVK